MNEIQLIRCPMAALSLLVNYAFAGDEDFFNSMHNIKGSAAECVEDTCKVIVDTHLKHFPVQLYSVVKGGQTIGYTAINTGYGILYSFGIRKAFRTKETVDKWFEQVVNQMPEFVCYLRNQNIRAIKALQKRGMEFVSENDYTVLKFQSKGE